MLFPIEKASSRQITDLNARVEIYEILNYPVKGLIFEGGNSLEDLSNAVADTCICVSDNNMSTYLTMYSFQNLANASLSFHRYILTTHLHKFII